MNPATLTRRTVAVSAPARLHLGIFALPDDGYGGIGLAIDQPRIRLTARPQDDGAITADGPQAGRALQAARTLAAAYSVTEGAHIAVEAAIPPHVGLGSGTQITLAAAMALGRLWDLGVAPQDVAGLAGRGARSRIGLETFRSGGFVAHATWRSGETYSRLLPVPPDWRFVLVTPYPHAGLSGAAESQAFAALPPMAMALRREARDLVELEILPGLERADRYRFGRGLLALQALVGDYFAPVQGARYAPPLGDRIMDALLRAGASGAGQSSWGPTMVGLVGSQAEAEQVRTRLLSQFAPNDLTVWTAAPDNTGVQVEEEP